MNTYTWEELQVGTAASFEVTVSAEMLQHFGATTGDRNPLHTDADYAAAHGFRDRVVYGMLTASFYSTLAGVYLPGERCLLHGLRVDFNAPVYVGDRLRVSGVIAYRNEAFRQAEVACTIANQDGEVVSKGKLKVGLLQDR
jgi:acyl dehydratase